MSAAYNQSRVLPLRDNVPTRSTPYVTVGLCVACFRPEAPVSSYPVH